MMLWVYHSKQHLSVVQLPSGKWLSCSDAAPGSVTSVSNVEISGQSAPGEGRKCGGWARPPTVIGLVQTGSPLQHSAISSPCSSQTSPTAFPSTSVSSQISLIQTILVLSMSPCLFFSLPCRYCCAQRSPPLAPVSSKQPSAPHTLVPSRSLFVRLPSLQLPSSPPVLLVVVHSSAPAPESLPCRAVCLHRGLLPPGWLSQQESSGEAEASALRPHIAWRVLGVDRNPDIFSYWH